MIGFFIGLPIGALVGWFVAVIMIVGKGDLKCKK